MQTLESLSSVLSDRLFLASLEGGVVLALVWLLTRRYGALPPSLQAWLWWAASLKLLVVLAGVPGLPLPVLPAGASSGRDPAGGAARADAMVLSSPAAVGSAPVAARSTAGKADPDPLVAGDSPAPGTTTAATPLPVLSGERAASRRGRITFNPLMPLTLLWVGGVAVALAQLVLSLRRVRRIVSRSRTTDARGLAVAAEIAARLEMTRLPEVRISRDVDVPQATGIWRPVVLLPESAECGWDVETLQMALCHELAHVRRRDLLAGWVPVLASRVFFFHPLAHLALREYLVAREAACDAIVLQALQPEPASYGRLLLRFGVTAPPSVFTAGGASASAAGLKRRLEMLSHSSFTNPSTYRWLAAAALSLALVPLDLVSRAEASPENPVPALAADADRQLPPQSPTAAADSSQGAAATSARPRERSRDRDPESAGRVAIRVPNSDDSTTTRRVEENAVAAGPRARTVAVRAQAAVAQQTQEQAAQGTPVEPEARDQPDETRAALRASERRQELQAEIAATQARMQALQAALEREVNAEAARRARAQLAAERTRALQLTSEEARAPRVRTADSSLEEQMQSLDEQLRALTRQQSELARQQEALVEAQREIAAQLQRVRDVLEQQRLRQSPEP